MKHEFQRYIFWQNIKSFHQSAFIRALAELPGVEVWFAFEEDLPESRSRMGWTEPDFGRAILVDAREKAGFESLLSLHSANDVHVFGDYAGLPKAFAAYSQLKKSSARLGWISEAFDYRGWKGTIRFLRSIWRVRKQRSRPFDRVFAMGKLGVDFFKRVGVRARTLREFGYTVEKAVESNIPLSPPHHDNIFRLVYVGQLIPRKGVDLLLRAVSQLPQSLNWKLTLVGDGIEKSRLYGLVDGYGISERVHFAGNIGNQQVRHEMANNDLLVLPSRWDGWGAVVNEALSIGIPVIVSDKCGAASLVLDSFNGLIFKSEDITDLSRSIAKMAFNHSRYRQLRNDIGHWAESTISAPPVAQYFHSCWQSDKALSPRWNHIGVVSALGDGTGDG